MKSVKKLMVALLVSFLATAAQADGSSFSLFHCGFQLGSASKALRADYSPSKPRHFDSSALPRSVVVKAPDATTFSTFGGARTKDSGHRRLPRAVTVARIGCSWR